MTRDGEDHVWAMALNLERLLLNARGAILAQDAEATDIEFRAALLTAAAHVIVELAPGGEDMDIELQATAFAKRLVEHLRRRDGRARVTLTERLLAAYNGPELS